MLHNHLFKNAGSTIDWALQKNFGSSFVDHRQDEEMKKGAEYLGPYLTSHKQVKALSTHHLRVPLPVLQGTELLLITMFRHPIERVTSVYKFEKNQRGGTTPGAIHAQKLSLADYIHWRMEPGVGATIRDFHTRRMLSKKARRKEVLTSEDMRAVKKRLSEMTMVGTVERFDESMVLFEDTLKAYFPDIDLSYVAQNIGQDPTESIEKRLNELREQIGQQTYDLLIEKNQKDIELYEIAQERVQHQIDQIPNFTEKLADFKNRCQDW